MTSDELCERAQRLIESGDFETAAQEMDWALKQEPESARFWHLKGGALGLAGKHSDALPCFERCTELLPRVFSGWYHKGVACTVLGKNKEAIECYRRARRLDPTDASSAFNLGAELCKTGALAEALEQFWAAKKLGHERAAQAHIVCRQMIKDAKS